MLLEIDRVLCNFEKLVRNVGGSVCDTGSLGQRAWFSCF